MLMMMMNGTFVWLKPITSELLASLSVLVDRSVRSIVLGSFPFGKTLQQQVSHGDPVNRKVTATARRTSELGSPSLCSTNCSPTNDSQSDAGFALFAQLNLT